MGNTIKKKLEDYRLEYNNGIDNITQSILDQKQNLEKQKFLKEQIEKELDGEEKEKKLLQNFKNRKNIADNFIEIYMELERLKSEGIHKMQTLQDSLPKSNKIYMELERLISEGNDKIRTLQDSLPRSKEIYDDFTSKQHRTFFLLEDEDN